MTVFLEEQRKEFMKFDYTSNNNVTLGGVRGEEQGVWMENGPCHGGYSKGNCRDVKYLIWGPKLRRNLMPNSERKLFTEWLTKESPWAPVFLSKDWKEIKQYGFVGRTDLPENFVISACIASRFTYESYCDFSGIRAVWRSLIAAGVSLEDAYLFSHLLIKEGKGWKVGAFSTGHSPFNLSTVQEDAYRNYWAKNLGNPSPRTFFDNGGYGGCNCSAYSLFSNKNSSSSYSGAFYKRILSMRPKSLNMAINHNIFKLEDKAGYLLTNKEDLFSIIDQIKEAVHA